MFEDQENQSEQTARIIIKAMRKSLAGGDLKAAARRLNRVKDLADDRHMERATLGELLLTAAEVARACGKSEQATLLVMRILQGTGGMSIAILGRAKRLRARILLDEGKFDEAEVLAGTADRYIVTGLIEERIEKSAGREYRVNVPVERKFLDKGEHISFETYFLLAEICVLGGNWEQAVWNIERARENYSGTRLFPELEFWRGILNMAKGESFIEIIEPALSHGSAPAILVGRIEALLNEPYREDSAINEFEYERYKTISRLAREKPFTKTDALSTATAEGEPAGSSGEDAPAEIVAGSGAKTFDRFASLLKDFSPDGRILEGDLSRMSMLRLNEVCDDEEVTGLIALRWNEAAVAEGIAGKLLDQSVNCGGGLIYCRAGHFVGAELVGAETESSEIRSLNEEDKSKYLLKQMLFIALGGGSSVLAQIQSRQFDAARAESGDLQPEIHGLLKRDEGSAERADLLKISSKLNFILDVSKELDEFRNGYVAEDEDIDWDAEWGPSLPVKPENTALPSEVPSDESPRSEQAAGEITEIEPVPSIVFASPFASTDSHPKATAPSPPLEADDDVKNRLPSQQRIEREEDDLLDLFDNNFETGIYSPNADFATDEKSGSASDKLRQEFSVTERAAVFSAAGPSDQIQIDNTESEIAPPWSVSPNAADLKKLPAEAVCLPDKPVPLENDLSLNSDDIDRLIKNETWAAINKSLVDMLHLKFSCGVRLSLNRGSEEFIVDAFGDSAENITAMTDIAYQSEFAIVEKIEWHLKADRRLGKEEEIFARNLFEIGKLSLLNLSHSEGNELRSIGGVPIADDTWLEKFMVPPRSLIMRKKINEVQIYATQDGITLPKAHILLGGETGTGKDVFAKLIHEMSERSVRPFVRADMGAVGGGDQFLATLFGAVRGSYTGQVGERRGLIEVAEGGTLFLNEIGNLSLESQRALLDLMQENCYTRLGDTKLRHSDVRLILATNENINDAGKFRQDVKFRCAPPVVLPPLRDRREDIASLAVSFAGSKVNLREAAIKILEFQNWRGNVRELSQVITTAVARIGGAGEITARVVEEVLENLNDTGDGAEGSLLFPVPPSGMTYIEAVEAYEKYLLEHSLLVEKKKSGAAVLWGISPAAITKKIKKWGLEDDD